MEPSNLCTKSCTGILTDVALGSGHTVATVLAGIVVVNVIGSLAGLIGAGTAGQNAEKSQTDPSKGASTVRVAVAGLAKALLKVNDRPPGAAVAAGNPCAASNLLFAAVAFPIKPEVYVLPFHWIVYLTGNVGASYFNPQSPV